jgi:peptide/nickel transport system substrate-binding protein
MNRNPIHAALLVAFLLTVSACQTSDSHGVAEDRPSNPLPLSAVVVNGEPGTFGYTMNVAVPTDLTTFNPYQPADSSTAEILQKLYAPLVGYNPVTREVLPQDGLAQSFELAGEKLTIRVREGLTFSDGTAITASDVAYSLKIALDPDLHSPVADMLTVSGRAPEVQVVDDTTLRLTFAADFPAAAYALSQIAVLSDGDDSDARLKARGKDMLTLKARPDSIACSGPFRVAAYERGKSITLKYNPNYWRVDAQGRRLPYLDRLVYKFGLAPEAVAEGLRTGTIDIARELPPAALSAPGAGEKFDVTDLGVGYGAWQLILNFRADRNLVDGAKATWMRNQKFREFVSRIMDREKMAADVFGGKAVPVYGPLTPAHGSWATQGITRYAYDVRLAQAARDAAGFALTERDGKMQLIDVVGRKVEFNLYHPKGEQAEALANAVMAAFAAQGVTIRPVAVDAATLLTKYLATGAFEMVLWRGEGNGPDPLSYLPVFMSNGSRHYFLVQQPGQSTDFPFQTDVNISMRTVQRKLLADERRAELVKAHKLWTENNPVIYLVADHVLVASNKRVGNIQPVLVQPYATWNAEQLFLRE